MAELVLISVVGLAACVLMIKVLSNWGERQFVRIIGARLSDAEHIVNEGQLPEAWVQPFRKRIEAIRRRGGSESKMERVGHQARQRYLHNLDDMIKFFQERNVTDGEDTRQFLLTSLKKRRDWVVAASWQDLLEPEASVPDAAETPVEA
jgi:hypothetical protein